jgi:hypothetical protein
MDGESSSVVEGSGAQGIFSGFYDFTSQNYQACVHGSLALTPVPPLCLRNSSLGQGEQSCQQVKACSLYVGQHLPPWVLCPGGVLDPGSVT